MGPDDTRNAQDLPEPAPLGTFETQELRGGGLLAMCIILGAIVGGYAAFGALILIAHPGYEAAAQPGAWLVFLAVAAAVAWALQHPRAQRWRARRRRMSGLLPLLSGSAFILFGVGGLVAGFRLGGSERWGLWSSSALALGFGLRMVNAGRILRATPPPARGDVR